MTAVSEAVAPHRTAGRAALVIAWFGAFMAFLDATIVNVCFPAIQDSFPDSSTGTLAWVLNAYNLVFAAALVAGGRLADLVGRRRTFLLGVVAFTFASVLCAVAPTLGWLIFRRVFQALGAALLVPASLGLVIQAASAERRAHAVEHVGAAAALAAGLGPPIGGALIEVSGWRLAFLVNLPLGIAAAIAGMRMLDESRSPGRRRLPDLAGVGILAVSLALISLAIVQGPSWHWSSVRTLLAFGGGAVLLIVVGRRSTRHPVPVSGYRSGADSELYRGQPGHACRGYGDVRVLAQPHHLAQLRLGLLAAHRRARGCAQRPGDCRRCSTSRRRRRAIRFPEGRCARRSGLGGRPVVVQRAGRHVSCVRHRVAAGCSAGRRRMRRSVAGAR